MKTKILLILTLLNVSAFAQSYFPAVFEAPITGFELLRTENPFILQQTRTNSNAAWVNAQLFIKKIAPNVNYIGLDKIASWQDTIWSDVQTTTDSFVLDNNKIITCFEVAKYNYPGFTYQAKSKYIYSYDQANRLKKIIFQNANPANSNNYVNTYSYNLNYDITGIRNYDSLYSYADNIRYFRTYTYNTSGKLIQELGIQGTDTVNKVIYELDGDLLKTAITSSFDLTTDVWTIEDADTFEYNSSKQITKKISWTTFSVDGVNTLMPSMNESYKYTTTNKLTEIISRQFSDSIWKNQSKITIEYDQNKASIAYGFMPLNETEWKTYAEQKYIFDETALSVKNIIGNTKTISVFPNPANEELNIGSDAIKLVAIFDITGKLVLENDLTANKIDVTQLKNGIYSVQLFNNEGVKVGVSKVVISH